MSDTNRSESRWWLACGFCGFVFLAIIEAVEPLLDPDQSYTILRFITLTMMAVTALVFLSQWLLQKPSRQLARPLARPLGHEHH